MTRSYTCHLAAVAIASLQLAAGPLLADDQPDDGAFLLIRDGLELQPVRLLEIGEQRMFYLDDKGGQREVGLDRCVAVFDPDAVMPPARGGLLELTDGQRLPGEAISNPAPDDDTLAWNHEWLGRLDVPLDRVRFLRFSAGGPATMEQGVGDRLLLANGDRLDGIVVSLGDPIALEVTDGSGSRIIEVPRERVSAVTMVAPKRKPAGWRVWFRDGSLVDVRSIRLGDDGFVGLDADWFDGEAVPAGIRIEHVAAVLFDADSMVPLASLSPSRIEGGDDRYHVPRPRVIDGAALGLSSIEFRGPLLVHYALPAGASRFAAEARLPRDAREWGDYELIVRDEDQVVFRSPLNGDLPAASINVPLEGSELTIELSPGKYGPIQDRLVLEGAMVGKESD